MRKSPTQLLAWARSAEFRAIARRQCEKMNDAHARKPRCSAIAKSTGVQCTQPAMKNGKCRFHGGRTPRGDAWHRPRWPDRAAPDATAKLGRKLADQAKQAKRRKRRLAAMSPEERAAHDAWQRSHKPGSAKRRASLREERRQALEARALISAPPSTAVASRMRSVNRGQLSPAIFGIDLASTWLRNRSKQVQARAIDTIAANVVNEPGLAADLLERFNPADRAARRRLLTQK